MTPIFCCGFECGTTGANAHMNLVLDGTISTTTVRSGSRSGRINSSGTAGRMSTPSLTTQAVWVVRCYVRFATLPNTNIPIAAADNGNVAGVYFKSSDSKLYAGSLETSLGATGVSVTTGIWYRIDFKTDFGASTVDVQVDGVACGQFSGSFGASASIVYFGSATLTTFTGDIFFDDIVISNTGADYPIGPGYVNHFIPTSDGTHNVAGAADFQRTLTGTDILNATTTAFQLVDDVPLESGAGVDWVNMIAPPNATDYVECIFGPAPGILPVVVAPRAVDIIAGIHQAGTGTGNMEIRMNDNGTTNVLYTATTVAGVTTIAYKRKHYATNIANGGAWTVISGAGNFNNLRVRFGSPAAVDANPDQYFDCIMIEAEFKEILFIKPININQSVNRASTY